VQSGTNVDLQDYLGETPIHKAARTGSMECVSLLTSHGARLYIRNNNGHTPAQVAAMCGYVECARYLEAAACRQETEAKGVYGTNQPVSNSSNTETNSFSNTIGEETVVEESAMDEDMCACAEEQDIQTDITINVEVLANRACIAGRKRGREDVEGTAFKRMRPSDTRWEENNACLDKAYMDSDDEYVGYDYNGIPQYSPPKPSPVKQSQLLECSTTPTKNGYRIDRGQLQYPARCIGLTGHLV